MNEICSIFYKVKLSLLPICWIALFQRCTSNNDLIFEKFDEIGRVDTSFITGTPHILKEEYYLVSGYKNNKKCEAKIDSFYCAVRDPNFEKYYSYWVTFYKKTKKMSKEAYKDYPRGIYMRLNKGRIITYLIKNHKYESDSVGIRCYKEIFRGKEIAEWPDSIFDCQL